MDIQPSQKNPDELQAVKITSADVPSCDDATLLESGGADVPNTGGRQMRRQGEELRTVGGITDVVDLAKDPAATGSFARS
ncbi:hypothetical protein ACFL2H_09375, partial [Planctomycetota bacterium]